MGEAVNGGSGKTKDGVAGKRGSGKAKDGVAVIKT